MNDKDSTVSYQLKRREKELDAVRRISQALFQHLPLNEIVEKALAVAVIPLQSAACCID